MAEEPDAPVLSLSGYENRSSLEFRLLHNWQMNMANPFRMPPDSKWANVWTVTVPKYAFKFDNVLYALFAISALYLLRQAPEDAELLEARRKYHGLALQEHRKAVATMGNANADAVCYASCLLVVDTFAQLQRRPLVPYTPPVEWLQMAKGVDSVFTISWDVLHRRNLPGTKAIAETAPLIEKNDVDFYDQNKDVFPSLLGNGSILMQDSARSWDQETYDAFKELAAFIGSLYRQIEQKAMAFEICRRFLIFSALTPKRFIDLVKEENPHALVVLAHFFALTANVDSVWWLGNTAEREIKGIYSILPPEWQPEVAWPMEAAGLLLG